MRELDKEIRSWARLAKKYENDEHLASYYRGGVYALRYFRQRLSARPSRRTKKESKR